MVLAALKARMKFPQAFDNTEDFTNKGASAVFSLNTVLGRKVNEIRISLADEVRERHANSQLARTFDLGFGRPGPGASAAPLIMASASATTCPLTTRTVNLKLRTTSITRSASTT